MWNKALLLISSASAALAAPPQVYEQRDRGGVNPGDPWCPQPAPPQTVGDGSPHQEYKYVQLTSPMNCVNNIGCEIANSDVDGKSTSWSGGASLAGWISGGYEVSEYSESGEVSNCQGETGDVICTWWRFAHTSYTVQDHLECGSDDLSDPYMIASPNSNNRGSGYLCGKNEQCKSEGHEFWIYYDLETRAGGPMDFPYSSDIENQNFVVPDDSQGFYYDPIVL